MDPLLEKPAKVRPMRQGAAGKGALSPGIFLGGTNRIFSGAGAWGGCHAGMEKWRGGGPRISPHLLYASCSCISMVEYSKKSLAPMLLPTISHRTGRETIFK